MIRTSCPDIEQLQAYANGSLVVEVADEIADHLDQCESCTGVIAELERLPEALPAILKTLPPDTGFLEWQKLAYARKRFPPCLNCPRCRTPLDVSYDAAATDVVCPSCGLAVSRTALSTLLPAGPQAMRVVGRFECQQLLGTGAFGEVWRARDPNLGRDVAVKIPRSGVLGDEKRFLREARAAAGLKHEGIITVHEVGHDDESNTTYIVSDYIRGVNLAEWLTGRRPDFSDAAELVADIADALDFAHRHGVVHRDLKPGNIMLETVEDFRRGPPVPAAGGDLRSAGMARSETGDNKNGHSTLKDKAGSTVDDAREGSRGRAQRAHGHERLRPIMMDFGLARHDAEGASTMTREGDIIGTRAYMSPEQAAGHGHSADARTDVWSLGVILYELLTGERPFRGVDLMILQQVLNDDPAPPRRLNNQIPSDLETITLKCLSKEPSQRYASAADLRDDLRRWLAGEPILARPVSSFEQAWRWAKRKPAAASATAAVVVGLVSVSWLSVILWDTNNNLKRSTKYETVAKDNADRHATLAREQSQLALQSLEAVIFDIQRGLKNVPGAGAVQRKLIQDAITRLEKIPELYVARSAIDRNTLIALAELGDLFLRIGASSSPHPGMGRGAGDEGPPGDAPPGPLTAARKVYEQAFDIAQRLAAADPTNAQAQHDLSALYQRLGDVNLQSGQVTEARRWYLKILESSQQWAAANPTDARWQLNLSVSCEKLGDLLFRSQQLTEARAAYQKSLEIRQQLSAADPNDVGHQRGVFIAESKLADVLLESGLVPEALAAYQNVLEISEKMVAADPSDALSQNDLSISLEKLAGVLCKSGELDQAREYLKRKLVVDQKLVGLDPLNVQFRRDLSISHGKLGNVLLQSGQVTEALVAYQKCLEIFQQLADADPSDALAQRDLSLAHSHLGDVLLQSNQVTEAVTAYQRALVIRQKAADADPNDALAQRDLWVGYYEMGRAEQARKQYDEAIAWYEKAATKVKSTQHAGRLPPEDTNATREMGRLIQQCLQSGIALGDWKALLEQPAELLPGLLEMRGTELVKTGQVAVAVQAIAKLRELGTATAGQLYNAACVYSFCAAAIKPEKDHDALTAEQSAARQRHIADALATLREAIAAGYRDFDQLQEDPDLAVLRDQPEFKALLPQSEVDGKN